MNDERERDEKPESTVVILATSFGVAAGGVIGAVLGEGGSDMPLWIAIGSGSGAAVGYVLVWAGSRRRADGGR